MPYAKCIAVALLASAAAVAATPPAGEAPPPARRTPDELEQAYRQATLVVEFQVDAVQAKPAIDPRLAWEARGPVLDVLKGTLLPGRISVHVDSVVRAFDVARAEIEGKQFVAALQTLGPAAQRRFQLVGPRAYRPESEQADRLRDLAEKDIESGSGGKELALSVRPLEKALPVEGPKVIEVRLTNKGKNSATYLQAPISEHGGRLYLPGPGRLRIRTTAGQTVADKGNVSTGMVPPPPPEPALILPGANFVETVDLDKYYDLPAGRYTLSMFLATPDGQGRVASNGFSFQVGAVNLPEEPETPPEQTPPPEKPTEKPTTPVKEPSATTPDARDLPDPRAYKPGEASFGLAGLLRPTQPVYTVGEPVTVELRLINTGPRTLAIDTRLERTLTVTVEPVGNSPEPRMIRQVIPWPEDDRALPPQRAYLREYAFWGRTLNLNTLYGKELGALEAPTPKEIADGKALKYERFGRNLFGFTKPGTYKITATYAVNRRPSAGEDETTNGKNPPDASKTWWTGNVQTNSITVRITEKGTR